MLTYEEAVHIAEQRLGVSKVRRDSMDIANDGLLLCFVPSGREWNKFFIIDPHIEKGVVYTRDIDWTEEYLEARADFLSGLQSQTYRLEISAVNDWQRTRQLLQALRIPLTCLNSTFARKEGATDWLTMDLTPIQQLYSQEGKIVFTDVDVNGRYRVLYGAIYFECFDFALFAEDGANGDATVPVDPQDDTLENEFEEYEEEDNDGFWEQLDDRPIE